MRSLLILFVICLLSGCDEPAPETRLIFPPAVSHFDGQSLSFRGEIRVSANDLVKVVLEQGDKVQEAAVAEVEDTFSVADVVLPGAGLVSLRLKATNDRSGNAFEIPIEIDRNALTLRMTDVLATDSRVYVTDARLAAIVEIDTGSGERFVFSSVDNGSGPAFVSPIDLVQGDGSLYLLDKGLPGIFRVGAETGDRQLVSGPEMGTGPELVSPRVMALDGGRVVVADPGLDAIVSVDLASGDREITYRQFVDAGPVILSPRGLAVLPDGRLLVADDEYSALISIDTSTDSFAVLANEEAGTGPKLLLPRDLRLDGAGNALILNSGNDQIVRVDLSTLEREIIQPVEAGIPVAFSGSESLSYVADNASAGVVEIDHHSGGTRELTRVSVGSGPGMASPYGVLTTQTGYLIADRGLDAILAVDPGNGLRQLAYQGGDSKAFFSPDAIAMDSTGERIFVAFSEFDLNGIVEIDSNTGLQRVIASPAVGDGAALLSPADIAFVPFDDTIVVIDSFLQRLVRVDPVTGFREVIAGTDVGSGEQLSGIKSLSHDEAGDSFYLLDSLRARVFEVDRVSGGRILLLDSLPDRDLVDIVHDGPAGRLLLLDAREGEILAWSLDTGALSTLSGPAVGEGAVFERPVRFDAVIEDQLAIVVDAGLDALFVVDLVTGDRVILSR